jgi:hypothetical protein
MNITGEKLKSKYHGNAGAVWDEICRLGGYGNVEMDHAGGLDIAGALNPDNKAISDKDKSRIQELVEGKTETKKEGK